MSDGSGRNKFYCNDCKLRFSAYARRLIAKPFCTKCGETINVTKYDKRDTGGEIPKRSWTTLEQRELVRLIEKGKRPAEIGSKLKRTANSIKKKSKRLGYSFG
jgi:hypothetical protein